MKLGFVSMPVTGHLNPMTALARKLQSRGNEVEFIGLPDVEPVVRAANLNFVPFCEKEYPVGSVAKGYAGAFCRDPPVLRTPSGGGLFTQVYSRLSGR